MAKMTITIPSFPASWMPKLISLALAVDGAYQAIGYKGDWQAAIHDHSVQTTLIAAVLAWVVKQSNVTGGNSGQPSTPQALADANQHPSVVNPPAPGPVIILPDPVKTP